MPYSTINVLVGLDALSDGSTLLARVATFMSADVDVVLVIGQGVSRFYANVKKNVAVQVFLFYMGSNRWHRR